MVKYSLKFLVFGLIITGLNFAAHAQMKRRTALNLNGSETVESQIINPVPTPTPGKKNNRPNSGEPQKSEDKTKPANISAGKNSPYTYQFSQPNFIVSRITIEHDESGKGSITFEKKGAEEPITDPLQISSASLEKINSLLQTLNFIDSNEDYQSPMRDYGHLGDNEVTLRKKGRERKAKYNWSENLTARDLAAEYRKIGEQAIWLFDMSIARDNQPLEAPGLMDKLDGLLRRNEISDPPQLIPVLKEFSADERIPLMARNHAARIIKEIEKKGPVNK